MPARRPASTISRTAARRAALANCAHFIIGDAIVYALANHEGLDEKPGGGDDNLAPHVNRILSFAHRLEAAGVLDRAEEQEHYALHRDLLPARGLDVRFIRALRQKSDLTIEHELAADLTETPGGPRMIATLRKGKDTR